MIERLNKIEGRHLVETEAEDDQIDRQRGELLEKQQQLTEDGIKLVAGSKLMQSRKTKKKDDQPALAGNDRAHPEQSCCDESIEDETVDGLSRVR